MASVFAHLAAGLVVLGFLGLQSEALSAHGCAEGRCGQSLAVIKEEGSAIKLSCPQGRVQVLDAFFGRENLNCGNYDDSLRNLGGQCNGRTSCSVIANSANLIGTPTTTDTVCPATANQVAKVTYTCACSGFVADLAVIESGDIAEAGVTYRHFSCEGQTMELECQRGSSITISFANYGRTDPDGQQCPRRTGHADSTNCISATSQGVVETACNNRNSCSVDATNTVFGDPCGGTFKYLEVEFSCN